MLPGVGVFGTTTTIRCLVPVLQSCGFNVVAVWGRTKDEADTLSRTLHISYSTNKVDEVLLHKDVDLVVISCPPHLQSPIAVKALNIGKHVLCGTPVATGQMDVLRMVNAARYYPKLMSLLCHGLRFLPTIMKMRQKIEDGYVGDVTVCEVRVHHGTMTRDKFDWMCDETMGGGVLSTIGSNIIDVISYLTNQKAVRVHGMLKTYIKQTEKIKGIREITSDDFSTFQMELDNSSSAVVTLNTHMPGQYLHEILICGSKGRLIAKGADLYGQQTDGIREELLHFDPINFKEEERYGISDKTRKEIPTPYLKGLIHLIDAVREAFEQEDDGPKWFPDPVALAATFEDSLYVQTVVDAIRASSKNKEWVTVVVKNSEPDANPFLSKAGRSSTFSLH